MNHPNDLDDRWGDIDNTRIKMTENNDNNKLQRIMPTTIKKVGIAARMDAAKKTQDAIDPKTVTNRLGIIFDDSGSMGGRAISDAKDAVGGFLRVCNPNDTSIAVYPLNKSQQTLVSNFALVQAYVLGIGATGGTPLYATLNRLIETESITRTVVFSDGEPTDQRRYKSEDKLNAQESQNWEDRYEDYEPIVLQQYIDKKIPIDTVFIGHGDSVVLQRIAEKTGGVYLHFTDTSVFAKNMKYLAPSHRLMLNDKNTRERVEKGQI